MNNKLHHLRRVTVMVALVFAGQTSFASNEPDRIELRITSTRTEPTLAGELVLPTSSKAGVLLLSVAGPNNRDMAFANLAPFRVLSDYLANNGIASLRLDDRGVGQSEGSLLQSSYNDLVDDAERAFSDFADHFDEATPLGIIGMSEGGALAPLVALSNQRVNFLVLLSAPGVPGKVAMDRQFNDTIDRLIRDPALRAQYHAEKARFDGLVAGGSGKENRERLVRFLNGPGRQLIPPYAFVPKESDELADMLLGPWYQSQLHLDPLPTLRRIIIPVLTIRGGKDRVLPGDLHEKGIRSVLAANKAVRHLEFNDLNHLLQSAKSGLPEEYVTLKEDISVKALEAISGWIIEQTKSNQF